MKRSEWGVFLSIFAGVAALCSVVSLLLAWLVFSELRDAQMAGLRASQAATMAAARNTITARLARVGVEVRMLSELPTFRGYLNDPADRPPVVAAFLAFIRAQTIFDRVTYLDESGHEKIRVNYAGGAPFVASTGELRPQGDAPYFQEAKLAAVGTTLVSRFDLDVDGGRVESPWKPALRVMRPVFDDTGQRRGALVLNYFGAVLLDGARNTLRDLRTTSWLVDGLGYAMDGPDGVDLWGFMFDRPPIFPQLHPQAWAEMRRIGSGQILVDDGLYTFSRVDTLGEVSRAAGVAGAISAAGLGQSRDRVWWLVARVPMEAIVGDSEQLIRQHMLPLGIMLAGGLLAGVAAAGVVLAIRRYQAGAALHAQMYAANPDPILLFGDDLVVADANSALVALAGVPLPALRRRPLTSFFTKADSTRVEVALEGLQTHGHWDGELVLDVKNRRAVPVRTVFVTSDRPAGDPQRHFAIMTDISRRVLLERKLREAAETDALTGARNRGAIVADWLEEFQRHRRYKTPASVLLLDIDHFKAVNDTHGHPAGDAVLRELVAVLRKTCREVDRIGRFGGEEFLVVAPNTSGADAMRLAERVRAATHSSTVSRGAETLRFTVSIGVATLGEDDKRAEDVIDRADQALYQAKNSGRDRAVLA